MLIEKAKYVSDYGVKDSKVSNWMQRHWTKGLHYFVIGRTTMIDTEEVNEWIRNSQQGLDLAETGLKLKSGNRESLSTKKLSTPTPTMRLTLSAQKNIETNYRSNIG